MTAVGTGDHEVVCDQGDIVAGELSLGEVVKEGAEPVDEVDTIGHGWR